MFWQVEMLKEDEGPLARPRDTARVNPEPGAVPFENARSPDMNTLLPSIDLREGQIVDSGDGCDIRASHTLPLRRR